MTYKPNRICNSQYAAIEPPALEKLDKFSRFYLTVEDKQICESFEFRRNQENAHYQQVERVKLNRHVVTHVEDEYLGRINEADQSSQQCRARENQQHAAQHFRETRKDFKSF